MRATLRTSAPASNVVQASGLPVELGPFGTRVEGPPDRMYALVSEIIAAAMDAGAHCVAADHPCPHE